MTRLGQKRSMKRSKAPRTWRIHRKEKKWTVKNIPGPHSGESSIPLLFILRDYLGYAQTRREAKIILNKGMVLVDGKVRRDERFPVGVMDVLEIPKTEEYYRVLPNKKGELYLHKIPKEEKNLKIYSIRGKKVLKKGIIQLNLHDGRNIIGDNTYNVHDTILYDLSQKEIKAHVPFKKNALGLVIKGNNVSKVGKILEIGSKNGGSSTVVLESKIERFRTLKEYIYIIGKGKPLISIPEVA
ncbi:MAG: 30S ribosomal protein S4e [Methanomicrobia archaeon]|nr:30S ribosomal protein S4e [Methanomicrobia archaeon]HDM22622.1 30S ribosomal protein S4e [Methanomicrobia archaeon]